MASNAIELGKITKQLNDAQSELDQLYIRWSELEKLQGE